MSLSQDEFREETLFIEDADGVQTEDDRLQKRVQRETHDDKDEGEEVKSS